MAIMRGHGNTILTFAFDPDGRRAVSASAEQTAWLWDGVTGERLAPLRDYSGELWNAIFSSDGTRVVTASADQTLRVWDSTAGQLVAVLRGHTADVHAAAFAAQSSLLVSVSSDGEARLWDTKLAEQNGILRGHDGFAYDVAFSPDGTRVASAAWDGTARVWEVTTGRQTALLQHEQGKRDDKIVGSVAWHPGGKQLVTVTRRRYNHPLGSGHRQTPPGLQGADRRMVRGGPSGVQPCGDAARLGESRRCRTSVGCGHRRAGKCLARARGFCFRRCIQPRTKPTCQRGM